MKDALYDISLLNGEARAILVESTQLVQKAMDTHRLSRIAAAALGRTLTACAVMGSQLKNDRESVSVQIKGGGPIGTVLAVAHGDLTLKGYVDDPNIDLPRTGTHLPVGAAVGNTGKMTVIKDLNLRDPYVGQVNLVSGEIAEDFAMYFTASEQTPSLVSLGVLVDDEHILSAGGLVIQMMPFASEEAISAVEKQAASFRDISETLREYHIEDAVGHMLGELDPVVLERREPVYRCDCSRERIERMLLSLGAQELTDIIENDHGAEISCHFCEQKYHFNEDELRMLLEAATASAKEDESEEE